MTVMQSRQDHVLAERRSFPAASRLHAQVEEQARELHDLRSRLGAALAELGVVLPTLHAAPLGPQRQKGPRPPGVSLDVLPPRNTPWWPEAPALREPMRPAPGRRCAGLLDERAPVLAVSLCGRSAAESADMLEQVIEQQITTRSFVPLFLTDDASQLHLFRHQGYDVELLPQVAALMRCPGAIAPETFLERRVAQIDAAWGVVGWIDMGSATPSALPPSARSTEIQPTLVFYKDYRRYNPYQHLLYASLPKIQAVAGDVEMAIDGAGAGPTLFHVNWEEAIYRDASSPADAMALVEAFLARLDVLAAAGGRVVWTLHNGEPHDNPFPAAYARLASGIAERSGLVVVHSNAAARLAHERYGVSDERLCLVPHGGYHTLYDGGWDRQSARRDLGLPEDRLVFGFIGNVRPYKNVPLLIEAFSLLPRGQACLLIAGHQEPTLDLSAVDPAVREEMVVHNGVVEETVLPLHLVACDAVVLPFGRILTSGSLMLALSLEVPVIVPAVRRASWRSWRMGRTASCFSRMMRGRSPIE
jgi:beta-1,4-mannosyltransferase